MALEEIIDNFDKKRILVVGDVMLDKYIWGKATRVSPEADSLVLNVKNVTFSPGGAGNVAANITALDAECYLFGFIGKDDAGSVLLKELQSRWIHTGGIDYVNCTIRKERAEGEHQQLLRMDYEEKIQNNIVGKMIENARRVNPDAIIISDYAKGTVNRELVKGLLTLGKNVFVDTKPANVEYYKGVYLVKPNKEEAEKITGMQLETDEDAKKVGNTLKDFFNSNIVITQGKYGLSLFELDGKTTSIQTTAKETYDVTGAGDTFMATLSIAAASGACLKDAAILANCAAGIKVGKVGTATVSRKELKKALEWSA